MDHLLVRSWRSFSRTSVVFFQVHAVVKAGDLIVAVKHKSFTAEEFPETALSGLAPTGMIDVGIDVGIETVFARSVHIPSGGGLTFNELYFDDGFDALKAVFPGNDEANRSAVLVGKSFAVHANAEQRERMHGLVEAQTFDVRELDAGMVAPRHLRMIVVGLKGDVFGFFVGLGGFENCVERIADPRNDDGPAFHAAMAINTLFERRELQDIVHAVLGRFFDFAFDGNRPG